ncbi:MAG TPA: MATE family efflux transporter [Acidobacteriaceae bacterium]|jgi:MATE family multidrug resistance protein|nr:MATE family efflux transporter [Acidobacteriaceae bacterium]
MHLDDLRAELPPLLRLAAPLVAGELGWMAMSVVDTSMVGRLPHSAVPMAAAALSQVLFNTFTFGVGGVLLGLDTTLSQAFGAREHASANRWLLHGLVLACGLAALLLALFTAGPVALGRMPVDRAVLAQAIPALRGLSWGVLPLLFYFALRRYLQAAHHAKPIAFALISANVVNFAGDWLLIYGHNWSGGWATGGHYLAIPAFGVIGSAWSTSFARLYLMAVLAIAVVMKDRRHGYGLLLSLRAPRRRVELQDLLRLFWLGAPAGAQIFVEIAVFAAITSIIATFGPLPLAGHEVALQCASTTFMVPFAISAATAVRVGHALGRQRAGYGQPGAAAAAGWSGILAGAAFMLVATVTFLTIPSTLARIFTPDPAVIAAAVPLLLVAAGFQFFDGVQITITGALRGSGNTSAPLFTHLVCYWGVGMPLGVALAFRGQLGAAGLWWGLLIALTGAALVLVAVWRRTTQGFTGVVTQGALN